MYKCYALKAPGDRGRTRPCKHKAGRRSAGLRRLPCRQRHAGYSGITDQPLRSSQRPALLVRPVSRQRRQRRRHQATAW